MRQLREPTATANGNRTTLAHSKAGNPLILLTVEQHLTLCGSAHLLPLAR